MAEGRRSLDFIIIGAPKAGTTSLFEYIRVHPEVHVPKWKETNFFLNPEYERGVEWYLDWVLAGAPEGAFCGEASVRYLAGTPFKADAGDGSTPLPPHERPVEEIIPARIKSALPDIKLIALLRDPVGRCMSEYQMAVLRGLEEREPDEAISDLLAPEKLERARARFAPDDCYVTQSEYGRILEPYFEIFSPEQLLVLFTGDLAADPGGAYARTCRFIGVDDEFVPPNLGVRYLEGSAKARVRALDIARLSRFLRRSTALRSAWRRLPASLRQRVWTMSYGVEKWNREKNPQSKKTELSPEVKARLQEHFETDGRRLAALTGLEPPWLKTVV